VTSTSQNEDLRAAWFGKVSPNWKLARAKNAFQVVSKKVGQRSSEYDLLSLTLRGIIPRDIESGKGKFPESFDTYQEVKESDIVFCLFDIDETPRTVGLSNIDGMITGAYTVVRCTKYAEPRFVTYFYRSIDERKGLRPFYTGLRKVVRTETFVNAAFPLPDLPTQRAIADFLDRETARIDSLIEKKQRLVELLGKKWEATVTFTLTNGLNADVLTKDSGVPWIGGVPDHWEVAKLGHIGRSANGINIGGDAFGSGSPFVSYGDVYRNPELPRSVEGLVQSTAEDRSRYTLQAGDVLFTRTSETIDEIGFSSVCMEDMPDAVFAGFLIRFRPIKSMLIPLFSKFLFRNERLRAFFSKEMMIVTRASLSQGLLQRMPVVIPPLNEQQEISEYLKKVEDTFVSVSEKTKASIDRLKEYRSALITSAVTGQIDVSTYAKSGTTDRQLDAIQSEMQA
jgi:type I restriction enzyme S subunit